MRSIVRSIIAASATILVSAAVSSAGTVTALDGSQGWFQFDTRANGSATISTDQPRDGNASLKITTTGTTNNKADVAFSNLAGNLGNLSNVNQLSLDYYIPSGNTAGDARSMMAVRLGLSNGDALVWEYASQTATPLTTDTWNNDVDLASQNFWYFNKATNTNFNNAGQYFSLSQWLAGTTGITGSLAGSTVSNLQISFGSGISGNFTGYADDVHLGFNGGSSYASNFETAAVTAVPAPNALAGGAALLLAFGAFRFFRSRVLA